MEFSIYPFKRYGKIRLYVRFVDHYENEVIRSTGISYGFEANESDKKKAKKEATEEAKKIVADYFDKHQDAYHQTQTNPRLSDYLEQEYWSYVEANCEASTLARYQNNLEHFIRICKDRPMDAFKRLDIQRYKQSLAISEIIVPPISVMLCQSFRRSLCHFR